jgi:hypothetical protein
MPYTAEQQRMINLALNLSAGAPRRVRRSLLEAMAVESNFRNLNYGDRDSQGVLQQRPSTGWGPPGNARQDIRQYLARALQTNQGFRGTAGQLAQAVQRSAFPERYDQRKAEAVALLRGSGGGRAVLGDTASAPTGDGRQALAMSLLQGLQSGRPTSPSELVSVFRAGQNGGAALSDVARGPAGNGASAFGATSKAWGGSKSIANQLRRGLGLQVTSAKRDTKATASGGISDHWKGSKTAFAYDLGGPTSRMDTAAVQLAHRLGIAYRKGQPLVATVNMSGYRIQVLYRTNVGGDHFDHIHVGVKRL